LSGRLEGFWKRQGKDLFNEGRGSTELVESNFTPKGWSRHKREKEGKGGGGMEKKRGRTGREDPI